MSQSTSTASAWPKLAQLDQFKRMGGNERAQYEACCPAHHDRNPSLSISIGDDGRLLIMCHKGCSVETIVRALGVEMSDLFEPKPDRGSNGFGRDTNKPKPRITATYDYRDEAGTVLYQAVRYEPKNFKQRRPGGPGRWIWDLQGVRRVPYRLPELLAADTTATVYLVEGEKDADRLAALGLVATTTAQGAKSVKHTATELVKVLAGRTVLILPDADDPGGAYAAEAKKLLMPVAAAVAVVTLPRLKHVAQHGQDVSDWLDRHGGTLDELRTLAAAALSGPPQNDELLQVSDSLLSGASDDGSWDGGELLCDVTPEQVKWLWHGYVPLGKLSIADGDPGLGKTLLFGADLAARVTTGREMPDGTPGTPVGGAGVVVFTAEDDPADTLQPRLVAAGGDLSKVLVVTTIHRPDPESGAVQERLPTFADLAIIERKIQQVSAKLVIFDPFVAYLPGKTNSYRDQDVRAALAPLARLAQKTGAAIVLIRHLNRGTFDNALYRGMGSIGIIGAARAGTLVVKDPDDEQLRIFGGTKSNLGPAMPSWCFRIAQTDDGIPSIRWEGQSERSAQEVLGQARASAASDGPSKIDQACALLSVALEAGPQKQADLERQAQAQGISLPTLKRARTRLGITTSKQGFGPSGYWVWDFEQRRSSVAIRAHVPEDDPLSAQADVKLAQYGTSSKGDHPHGDESLGANSKRLCGGGEEAVGGEEEVLDWTA